MNETSIDVQERLVFLLGDYVIVPHLIEERSHPSHWFQFRMGTRSPRLGHYQLSQP